MARMDPKTKELRRLARKYDPEGNLTRKSGRKRVGRKLPKVKVTQADRVCLKFGGARRLTEALKSIGKNVCFSSVYRWTWPKERGGTGGIIPARFMPFVIQAARAEGVFFSAEDLDPRETDVLLPGIEITGDPGAE